MNVRYFSGFSRQKPNGFTLVELLVVVSIIGILAGLMIPITGMMITNARNNQATNTAHQLKNAISSYVTDYRKFPVRSAANEKSGDSQLLSDHTLMDVLLAADNESEPGGLNPGRTVFFTGSQAKPTANGGYRAGVQLSGGGAGELWDPFGEHFRVILDTDNNGRITSPKWFQDVTAEMPVTIAIWSAGKDRDDMQAKDNQKTW